MDLSFGKQAIATMRATKVPLVSRQKVQKAKEEVHVKWKCNGKRRFHPRKRVKGRQRNLQSRGPEEEVAGIGHTSREESCGTVFLFSLRAIFTRSKLCVGLSLSMLLFVS